MYFRISSWTSWSTQRLPTSTWIPPDRRKHIRKKIWGFSKPSPKLVPNLCNKTNYIIHCRHLKLYVELGLRFTNIHCVLLFDQSPWLKNYINFNTRQCTAAKNDFKKIFWSWWTTQALINLLYVYLLLYIDLFIEGKVFIFIFICSYVLIKTMENLRNRRTVDLMTSEENLKKLAAQPSFKQFKIFHKNLVAEEQAKVELMLNQPIHVGFAILDLSKTLMYDFHYNHIKQKYPDSKLLFTNTDSLTYQIQRDK